MTRTFRPRRPVAVALAALLLGPVALAGCGGGSGGPSEPEPPEGPGAVASIVVTLGAPAVEVGATTTVRAEARDADGRVVSGATIAWSSSAPTVATVDGGTVTPRVAGRTAITATSGSVTGRAELEVRPRDISAIVETVRAANGLPALSGAIVTRDGLVAVGASGMRRAGGSQPVTLEDRWHIGSNLKAVTAALAAVAVTRGRITWTTTVAEAFPELGAAIRAEYRDVTLEDLLANRGRIRNDPPASAYAGTTARAQRESLVRWALAAAPIGPRGSYHYSNPSFAMAGAMIERALGGTYEELLGSELATPLGVTGLGWGAAAPAGSSAQPVGHRRQGSAWVACEACDNPPGLSAAGRAHMRMQDWAFIVAEMLRADAGTSTRIGAAPGRKLFTAHTPIPNSGDQYALGWIATTRPWAGGRAATHAGSNTLNHSVAWLGLGNGTAFLAATNASDDSGTALTGRGLDALVGRMIQLHQTGS